MNFQGQHRSAAEKAEPVQHDPAAAPRKSRRSRYAWIGTAASVVLFAVSLGVLWKLVQSVSWAEVRTAIKALIRRKAEYDHDPAAASSLPEITMKDLPPL